MANTLRVVSRAEAEIAVKSMPRLESEAAESGVAGSATLYEQSTSVEKIRSLTGTRVVYCACNRQRLWKAKRGWEAHLVLEEVFESAPGALEDKKSGHAALHRARELVLTRRGVNDGLSPRRIIAVTRESVLMGLAVDRDPAPARLCDVDERLGNVGILRNKVDADVESEKLGYQDVRRGLCEDCVARSVLPIRPKQGRLTYY